MRNEKLAAKFRKLPCVACGNPPPNEGDHILAFGRDSDKDVEENMWALCRSCHQRKGWGLDDFVLKHELREELVRRGFWHDGRRWRRRFVEIK